MRVMSLVMLMHVCLVIRKRRIADCADDDLHSVQDGVWWIDFVAVKSLMR